VDSAQFSPALAAQHRAATRAELDIDERTPLLLFVGSGFERKGVPQLLRAAAGMRRAETRLVIVGADRKLAVMRRLARRLGIDQRVHFTGPVQDVRRWYGAADGFVLPTFYDPCPNAALEALACALPMVTSTTCGAREWVRSGENGWVIDAADVEALSRRLDDLADLRGDPAPRAAARAVAEPLTLSAMAERLLKLYRSLA
jgi:UDP-glucose:(heptosyl)LPS alpha-1,3-glucosyltransferase